MKSATISPQTPTPQSFSLDRFQEFSGYVSSQLEDMRELLLKKDPTLAFTRPVDTKELCAFLGVTEPTIVRYRKKGVIPFMAIGSAYRYEIPKVVAALENKKRG